MPIKKKITRKIISSKQVEQSEQQPEVAAEILTRKKKSNKGCLFCQKKSSPSYTDLTTLRRFLTDRAKIVASERSGVCSKHQRAIARNIKYARHLALLPFVPKV